MKGVFLGIGVGPGAPDLLTYRAGKILRQVDRVAAPISAPGRPSSALAVVEELLPPQCPVTELIMPMTRDTGRLGAAWEKNAAEIAAALDGGEQVAFLTLGDPMLYSTYIYLYGLLGRAGYRVKTVPGVTSFSAAAALAGIPLAFGDERVALMTGPAFLELPSTALASFDSLVLFKVASSFSSLVEALAAAGFLAGAVLVESCGLPAEKVYPRLELVRPEHLSYFSMILSRKELLP